MIKELFSSLIGNFHERISSPFFGSFVTAWLVINWRILYTIVCPLETAAATIAAIEGYCTRERCFYYPLGFSLFYIIIFPWIKNGIFLLQATPKQWHRRKTFQWEEQVLREKRGLVQLETELSLLRQTMENKFETDKRNAEAGREEHRLMMQQNFEERKLQLEEKRLEIEAKRSTEADDQHRFVHTTPESETKRTNTGKDFVDLYSTRQLDEFLKHASTLVKGGTVPFQLLGDDATLAIASGLAMRSNEQNGILLTNKGRSFIEWYLKTVKK